MSRLLQKNISKARRAIRVRSRIHGSATKPRLSINVSNLHVTAQLIDDDSGKTIAYSSSVGNKSLGNNLSAKAAAVGSDIAKKAAKAKIKSVVFDRGSRLYHGRTKALADAAREGGLEF